MRFDEVEQDGCLVRERSQRRVDVRDH